jgi:sulfite oxidase
MDKDSDIILAYEMNGEPLTRDHGFPLRLICPGMVGAKSVKWLSIISVVRSESPNMF